LPEKRPYHSVASSAAASRLETIYYFLGESEDYQRWIGKHPAVVCEQRC
jgi:hypothetical protein